MKPETVDRAQVTEALGALRQELTRLGERVAALEAALVRSQESGVRSQESGVSKDADTSSLTPDSCRLTPEKAEGLSEELLLVISAAVAAFLGKKPHIRQIRLLGTATWAQQGRVTIQASHALSARHTRSQP